jgi:hypothetical protein
MAPEEFIKQKVQEFEYHCGSLLDRADSKARRMGYTVGLRTADVMKQKLRLLSRKPTTKASPTPSLTCVLRYPARLGRCSLKVKNRDANNHRPEHKGYPIKHVE